MAPQMVAKPTWLNRADFATTSVEAGHSYQRGRTIELGFCALQALVAITADRHNVADGFRSVPAAEGRI